MAVRQRKATGGGSGAGAGDTGSTGEERALAALERVLRGVYEAARSGRRGRQEHEIELPELGGLLVKVYAQQYEQEDGRKEYAAVLEVFKRGHPEPLCKVELYPLNREPSAVYLSCWKLMTLASRCARGEGCVLSWEEARAALKLAGWAVNRLAELAGIPAKVERTGLVKAYDIGDDRLSVLPCLQVSVNGKSYSVCRWARLSRNPGGSWEVKGLLRLVPVGKRIKMMAVALAELEEMVSEYIRSREREGAKSTHASKHRGEFLGLEEVVLRQADGTEEVLLEPVLYKLIYIGEDFAVVDCLTSCPEGGDSELADAVRKELEEAWGVVVQAGRRYTEEHDPRYAALAYIVVEALGRAGLA